MKKIGIFAGTFDPIHQGHSAFLNAAIKEYKLDKVLILLEKDPKFKTGHLAYDHRKKMVKLATASSPKVSLYETDHDNFLITNCLPLLRSEYSDAKLYLLIGDDVAQHIMGWEGAASLFKDITMIVGKRSDYSGNISSAKIRRALKDGQEPLGLAPAVWSYINEHHLYTD